MAIFQIAHCRRFLSKGCSWVFYHIHAQNLCLDLSIHVKDGLGIDFEVKMVKHL